MKKILLYGQVAPQELKKALIPLYYAAKRDFAYEGVGSAAMQKFMSGMVIGVNLPGEMLDLSGENIAAIYYFRSGKDNFLPIPGIQTAPVNLAEPFALWKGIPLYVLPSVDNFIKYFKRGASKKARAQRKLWLKCMFDLVQSVRGTSVHEIKTRVRWCYDVPSVLRMVEQIQQDGICAVDTETMPASPEVPADKWLHHNTSFWLAKTRILLFASRIGEGWVVPSFDPISWFNVGAETDMEFISVSSTDDSPHKYLTDDVWEAYNETGDVWDQDDIDTLDPNLFYLAYRDKEVVCDYLGNAIYLTSDQVNAFLTNIAYAKDHNISDLFADVVGPALRDGIIQNEQLHKVFQNYVFDRNVFKWPGAGLGWEVRGLVDDTMKMMHADSKVGSNALKPNAEKLWSEFLGWGDEIDYVIGPLKDLGEYGAVDLDATLRIYQHKLLKLLKKPRVYYFYRNALLGSQEWFGDLEYEGDMVDLDRLQEVKSEILAELGNLKYQMLENPRFKQYVANTSRDLQQKNLEVIEAWLQEKLSAVRASILAKLTDLEAQEKTHLKSYTTWKSKLDWVDGKSGYDPDSPYAYKFVQDLREKQAKVATGDTTEYMIWDDSSKGQVIAGRHTRKVASATQFNFESDQQLIDFVYESEYGLKFQKIQVSRDRKDPKTGKKRKVTEVGGSVKTDDLYWIKDKDKSGFIKTLMTYKIIDYYRGKIEELEAVVDSYGRIHSSYMIISTDRTSSKNPNMQNVPQRTFVDDAKPFLKKLLSCFVAPEGWWRGKCDLAQAEIRVFSELYGIEKIAEFIRNDDDLHMIAAKTCMDISDEEWNQLPDDKKKFNRTFGKILNFGLLYGASVKALIGYARDNFKIIITPAHGKEMRRIFFEVLYSEIPEAHRKQIEKLHRLGYCETLFGSRKDLPDLYSQDNYDRSAAERQGINMPVQGTAGIYMYWVAAVFNLRRIVKGYRGRLMNIIHDDLPSFVPPEELESFARDLMATSADPCLQEYFGFSFNKVPMSSDFEYGKDWASIEHKIT